MNCDTPVSPYLVIKHPLPSFSNGLALYVERYEFEPGLRDEYCYEFLVVFLIESRQIL